MTGTPRVAIIGAGMSGICMGIRLLEAGIDTFTIYEKGPGVGGTWRANTYPGVQCDIPSAYYSYSFAPNAAWSHLFSPGEEIWNYFEAVADRFGVRPHMRFNTPITASRWVGDHWELDGGEDADFLIAATGVLHQINVPPIEGLESFAGALFHSSRWDHSAPLDGARVGLIGTGSTGVQITTALAGRAKPLTVFQRTPQWVLPVPNPAMPRWLAQRPRLLYKVLQRWTEFTLGGLVEPGLRRKAVSAMCARNLASVKDPVLRAKLTPNDQPGCRRLIAADGYYEALQRPDVAVVTDDIERVEPAGVRTRDGVLHELDVLVLATGFDPHAFMRPMHIEGLDGLTLADAWADGARGYRSVALPGFPNLFTLLGPHSPFGNQSQIMVAETQVDYAMQWIRRWPVAAAPTVDAMERFNAEVHDALSVPGTVWVTGCKSWYKGKDGLPEVWPWLPGRHREMLAEPVEEDWASVS